MRATASILHLDLDAFFAAVEQRDKPSLRGKPVVVGGVGVRGVVATASYEARAFGIHSAMPTSEARRRCPNAAFLSGRFDAYRATSQAVMSVLRNVTDLVEPLSLDEAFVDLSGQQDTGLAALAALAQRLRAEVYAATGGLTCSVGLATSKLVAKIASELNKPDGLVVVPPGTELDLLRPMKVDVIPGVGPATRERLRRLGVTSVADLLAISEDELVRVLGQAHGRNLFRLARNEDDRPVVAERETKSISVEGTYESDLADPRLLDAIAEKQADSVARRLRESKLSGRTITVKVRLHDFTTHTRSSTLTGPTDEPRIIARTARRLIRELDTAGGVRLLGVGVSGLTDWIQEDLFGGVDLFGGPESPVGLPDSTPAASRQGPLWSPGMDIHHEAYGAGWVWGSGKGIVTVRFETAETGPGRVLSFAVDDPALSRRSADDAPHPDAVSGEDSADSGAVAGTSNNASSATTPTTESERNTP